MKSIAVLDPASMRVQVDLSYYYRALNDRKAEGFVDSILESNTVGISNEFKKMTDPALRARAGVLAVTIWHEHRHFLDFLLTNWGASWNRLYLRWINFYPCLLDSLHDNHLPLPVPLDRVLCPVSLESLGIDKSYPEPITNFALKVEEQLESMRDDSSAIAKLGSEYEIGGRSQLECLAAIAQASMSNEWLGDDLIDQVNAVGHRMSASSLHASKIITYMRQMNLIDGYVVDGHMKIMKPTLPTAIITAALCCRRSPTPKSSDFNEVSGYFPIYRLSMLCKELSSIGPKLNSAPAHQVWAEVQRACHQIWGRTPEEEIEADINWMQQELNGLKSGRVNAGRADPITDHFVEIMSDIIDLRRLVLNRFKDNVVSFIDPRSYAQHLGPDIKPRVLACAPHGYVDLDRNRFTPVHVPSDGESEVRWWSAVSSKWDAKGSIALPDTEAWHVTSRDYGPVANFLMRGHFDADAGVNRPDRALAHLVLQNSANLDVRIFNNFRRPAIDRSANRYFKALGEPLKCDICSQELLQDDAVALTRYDIMTSIDLKFFRERYLSRCPWDWSDWLVHSRHLT